MKLFKRKEPTKPVDQKPAAQTQETARSPASSPFPVFPLEPDYSDLSRLQPYQPAKPTPFANLLVVGIGAVGEAVLQALLPWLSLDRNDITGVQLLVVRSEIALASPALRTLSGQQPLPESIKRLVLPASSGQLDVAWSPRASSSPSRALSRVDGRLSVFHDLAHTPSSLWEEFRQRLASRPDVWLVGSAFDLECTGMIFDIAHIVRLVGRALRYEPSINWMLTLPGESWGRDGQPIAVATLRELQRLLSINLPRNYAYVSQSQSTNRALWEHQQPGGEDANTVFLCEPPEGLRSDEAGRVVFNKMALALFTWSQSAVWDAFRGATRDLNTASDRPVIGSFGVCAHFLPLVQLQALVRARITRDVLLSPEWGVVRRWSESQVEANLDEARNVLRRTNDPLLEVLSQGRRLDSRTANRSLGFDTVRTFRRALRSAMQEIVDRGPTDNGLLSCRCLIEGLNDVLARGGLTADAREALTKVLEEAQQELEQWQRFWRIGQERAAEMLTRAEEEWESSARSQVAAGLLSVLRGDAAQQIYDQLVNTSDDLRLRIRQYVRLAWVIRGQGEHEHLSLFVDTLTPGFDRAGETWRHSPLPERWEDLWRATQMVVEALTRDPGYWPRYLTAPGTTSPKGDDTYKAASLCLRHTTAGVKRIGYVVSGDAGWREKFTLPPGVESHIIETGSPGVGVLFQLHYGIGLDQVQCLREWTRDYERLRGMQGKTLHIFEAEQWAAQIEAVSSRLALGHRGLGATDQPFRTWLSPKTVAALQWPDRVKEFVQQWIAGQIGPAVEATTSGEHPLQALYDYVFDAAPGRGPRGASGATSRVGHIQLGPLVSSRLEAIEGWLESQDPADVEWYLLVHGLLAMQRE